MTARMMLCMVICAAATAYAQRTERDQSVFDRPLRVGISDDFPPFEYTDDDGEPAGYDVDMMRAAAKVVGLDLEFKAAQWSEVRGDLESGKLDALTGMLYSRERDRTADFCEPLMRVLYTSFVRKGSPPIHDESDLTNKTIIVESRSRMHDQLLKLNIAGHIIEATSEPEALRRLAAGEGDAALVPHLQGLLIARQYKLTNVQPVGPPIYSLDLCFAVGEGNRTLQSMLNTGLAVIRRTGEASKIYDQWFGGVAETTRRVEFGEVVRVLAWLVIPLAVVLLMVLAWSRSLRRTVAQRTAELRQELADRRRAEERYRTLVEIAPLAIEELDLAGRIISINPAGLSMLGAADPREVLGRTCSDLAMVADMQRLDELFRQSRDGQVCHFEFTLSDGRSLAASFVPIFDQEQAQVVRVMGLARDITERVRHEQRRRLLMSELDHRVKNNLHAVLALAAQTISSTKTLPEFEAAFIGRVRAMAQTHEALARSQWTGADLHMAVRNTLGAFLDTTPPRITFDGPPVTLPLRAAMPVCLALHELVTNATKYGALSNLEGHVTLTWSVTDQTVTLRWMETGGPRVGDTTRRGAGIRLIEGLIGYELQGNAEILFSPHGLVCILAFSIRESGVDRARSTEVS